VSDWYDDFSRLPKMAADTHFTFTEGHIRLLIWMCEVQQETIQEACEILLQRDEQPSDALLHAREGVLDLKTWGYRLLATIEDYEDEDGGDDDTDEVGDTEAPHGAITSDDIKSFREALEGRRPLHRNSAKRKGGNFLQKLRRWYMSL